FTWFSCCSSTLLMSVISLVFFVFFFQAEDGIRDFHVTGVQTCALPISSWPSASRYSRETDVADTTWLDWPFFDDGHRSMAAGLEAWCVDALARIDHRDTDAACRKLVS